MAKIIATIRSGNGSMTVTVENNGKIAPYTVTSEHPVYAKLTEAVKNNDPDTFLANYSVIKYVEKSFTSSKKLSSRVVVNTSGVYLDGELLNNSLSRRMMDMFGSGYPVDSLVKFLENLLENPSSRSIQELYDFLEHRNLPITEDGCFLAYKSVRSDYYSKASGTLKLIKGITDSSGHIYNGVGEEIVCPRNQVDDERGNECSHGLHVGALAYSGPQGWYHGGNDKVVIVKINPKDAVSVPRDHNAQKLRVCAYTVLADYSAPLEKEVYTSVGNAVDTGWGSAQDSGMYDYSDIMPQDLITFDYTNEGETKTRHLQVKSVTEDSVHGVLTYPEENAGELRNFKASKISNVKLVTDSE